MIAAPIQANRVLEKVKSLSSRGLLREKYINGRSPTKDVTKIATEVERDRWLER